jgi:hypothetical protein
VINEIPADIRDELKKYKEHRNLTCLECGYTGLMGIVKEVRPWYCATWLIILLALSGIGWIPLLIIMLGRAAATKALVNCPNCHRNLGPV